MHKACAGAILRSMSTNRTLRRGGSTKHLGSSRWGGPLSTTWDVHTPYCTCGYRRANAFPGAREYLGRHDDLHERRVDRVRRPSIAFKLPADVRRATPFGVVDYPECVRGGSA